MAATEALGKVSPYGVYDETTNTGWVSVGIDHDTAEFAVETMRRWWRNGEPGLPPGEAVADHGGWRRVEWEPLSPVEGGVAEAGGRERAAASRCVTSRRGRASGTRSSTGCSATSRRTGGVGRW